MSTATLTSKGQITIPKVVRDFLALNCGDSVDFVIEAEDRVVLSPSTAPLRALKGFLPPPKVAVSLEDMNAAIRKRAGRRWEPSV